MQSVHGSTILAFPRRRKRGPKVRTGPSAAVITLPTLRRTQDAISEASSPVEQLATIMDYASRKYGTNRPPVDVLIAELLHARSH